MIYTLYTDFFGIQLNQEGESFVGTFTNLGQGFVVEVDSADTTLLDFDLVDVKEGASLISVRECPEEEGM